MPGRYEISQSVLVFTNQIANFYESKLNKCISGLFLGFFNCAANLYYVKGWVYHFR